MNVKKNLHFKLSSIEPHNCSHTKAHFSNVNLYLKKKQKRTCNLSRHPQIKKFRQNPSVYSRVQTFDKGNSPTPLILYLRSGS